MRSFAFNALTATTAAFCVIGSARATLVSFASDVNSNGYTFAGTAGNGGSFTITEFSRPNTFTLLVDDDNGPLATVPIPVEFRAMLTAGSAQTTLVSGSLYQHTYRVTGTFGFYDAMGDALLTVNVGPTNGGFLTVPGTLNGWSSSGAVLGADSFADVTYTATSAFVAALGGSGLANQYGVNVGSSVGPDDFGFDLSVINGGEIGLNVALDANTGLPASDWRSESSFSGSAFGGIPSPGSVSLLAAGGLISLARRRPSRHG